MKTLKITAIAATLAAGTAMAAPFAIAQQATMETETQVKPDELKKPVQDGASAAENAPGQLQKSGELDSAAEAAPGQLQKSGEVDSASEAAPGQMKEKDAASADEPSQETTASIDISGEQRTEIREVVVESDVEPLDVDFDVSVGVAVPDTVVLHPLPPRIVEIVPDYESYQYFVLADGRIIIVEPDTLEVVYIITA